jgi:uncharacterized membrane protein
MTTRGEKTIYQLFEISVLIKALGSIGEMVAGAAIAFVPSTLVLNTALFLSQGDIGGDADDFVARGLVDVAHWLLISNSLLIGAYLFARGFIQFLLVIALFKNKLWAYPAMLAVLLLFVITQAYQIYLSHSILASVITLIDIVTIYFVWKEYNIVRKVV